MLSQTKKKESSVPHTKRKKREWFRENLEKRESFFFCFIVIRTIKKLLILVTQCPAYQNHKSAGLVSLCSTSRRLLAKVRFNSKKMSSNWILKGFLNRHGLDSNGSIVGTGSEHEDIFQEIVNYFPVAISPGGQTLNTMRCVKVRSSLYRTHKWVGIKLMRLFKYILISKRNSNGTYRYQS